MVQTWSPEGVRQERTGWRCEEISRRHREWGYNCPAVDLDFLMVEYNYGAPVALVEYKNRRYSRVNTHDRTYDALKRLADEYKGGPLPFLIAVYDESEWWFVVHPLNNAAQRHYSHCAGTPISEQRFVKSLYLLRKRVMDDADRRAISRLNTVEPAHHGRFATMMERDNA